MKLFIKNLSLITIFILQLCGQDRSIFDKYVSAVKTIKTVRYSIEVKMVFTDGTIWDNKGMCAIAKDTSNHVLGFKFLGNRFDVPQEGLYDGGNFYSINHREKFYKVERNPGYGILGTPEGQMVVNELVNIDTGYSKLSTFEEDRFPVIQFDYRDIPEDNIKDHKKFIFLDKKTFLPVKVFSTLKVYDKIQETTFWIKDLETNKYAFSMIVDGIDFLTLYQDKTGEGRKRKELDGIIAPVFTLQSFDSTIISFSDFRGKYILLDFWETWCTPCIESMPKIQEIYDHYKSKGLIVLGINTDQKNLDVAKLILKKNKVTFVNLRVNEKIINDYDILGVPRYIVIDEQGKILYSREGYDDSLKDLILKKFSN